MTNPIDELLALIPTTCTIWTYLHGPTCTGCQTIAAADRVREWRARGELSDQTLLELFYAEDVSPGEVLRGLRAVERAVRELSPKEKP